MSIREIKTFPSASIYKNDYDIYADIKSNIGNKILDSAIYAGNIYDMREGETQIDFTNKRKVIKIKGSLYKETIDTNNNVILTKIEEVS